MHSSPNRYGPVLPNSARQVRQISCTRAMSAATGSLTELIGVELRKFIHIALRRSMKPECISALTDRALARAALSRGHSALSGNVSARYSQIASESQIVAP